MERITIKRLEELVFNLNTCNGLKTEPWDRETGKANIGTYYIEGAYGGVSLVQMVTDGGGIRDISGGFCTKRELYEFLRGFIRGMDAERR